MTQVIWALKPAPKWGDGKGRFLQMLSGDGRLLLSHFVPKERCCPDELMIEQAWMADLMRPRGKSEHGPLFEERP